MYTRINSSKKAGAVSENEDKMTVSGGYQEDPLSGARGCANALFISLIMWSCAIVCGIYFISSLN